MATKRFGKPYIYVTWLAQLLGGRQCLWSAWFKAHFKYEKFEEMAFDLVKWNRDHNRMMAARVKELRAEGWTVTTEDQNSFKLEGASAVVAGKPDIVATKDDQILVVDGKTGKRKDADIWQVFLYLFAIPKSRPDLKGMLSGEVQYRDETFTVTPDELTPQRMDDILGLIKVISADQAPAKAPSRDECKRCNIGSKDCPQRIGEQQEARTLVNEF